MCWQRGAAEDDIVTPELLVTIYLLAWTQVSAQRTGANLGHRPRPCRLSNDLKSMVVAKSRLHALNREFRDTRLFEVAIFGWLNAGGRREGEASL